MTGPLEDAYDRHELENMRVARVTGAPSKEEAATAARIRALVQALDDVLTASLPAGWSYGARASQGDAPK